MDLTVDLAAITVVGTIASLVGYFAMKRKFEKELAIGKIRENELSQKIYEAQVLHEIGERIGYSLDAVKIVEIISGSLGRLLPYSAVSYLIADENDNKIKFWCNVSKPIGPEYVKDVKAKLLASFSEMSGEPAIESDVDESVSGGLIDEKLASKPLSYFNLPIVISDKLVGVINVSSSDSGLYNLKNTEVLYKMSLHASDAVTKLRGVLDSEKGRLSQALESLSDGVLMVDHNFKLVLINKRLAKILGIKEDATILDVVHALSGQVDLRTIMETASSAEDGTSPHEITLKDKVLQVYACKVTDTRTAKPLGVVVSFQDISASKSLERLRSDFMAMMVHELRAPLTTIKSTIEMVHEDPKMAPGDVSRYLTVIESTAQSMLELVNDLLDVAKLEAGKFDILPENADLKAPLADWVESFKPQVAEKKLELKTLIADDLPMAYFDKIRVKQVLNNLMSNAIKYTETGEIVIKAKTEMVEGHPIDILVSISDTGIGIDPSQTEKLFSKFSQLRSGRQQAGLKSSGLGLFIAKGIVEAMGGKIWVESAGAGLGSTFFFTVPLANSESKEAGEAPPIIFSTKKVAQA